jgi:hypothetical protein
MMQTTSEIFQPVFLLPPTAETWATIRENASGEGKEIEFTYNLSTKPHAIWHALYVRTWSLYFPNTEPPMLGGRFAIIRSEPATLQSKVDLLKVFINLTNDLSAPLIRGQAAQAAASQRRAKALDALELRNSAPLTAHSDGEVELNLRGLYVDRQRTLKEIDLAEIDAALSLLAESEIDEALSKL